MDLNDRYSLARYRVKVSSRDQKVQVASTESGILVPLTGMRLSVGRLGIRLRNMSVPYLNKDDVREMHVNQVYSIVNDETEDLVAWPLTLGSEIIGVVSQSVMSFCRGADNGNLFFFQSDFGINNRNHMLRVALEQNLIPVINEIFVPDQSIEVDEVMRALVGGSQVC